MVAVGSFVSAVTADSQSSVFYQIKDGNVNGAFDINPSSGVVTTRRTLDYETLGLYRLTVQGTNMAGMVSNATLIVRLIDENDNAPVFARAAFEGTVSESAPLNSVVLTQDQLPLVIRASDDDRHLNGRLVYQIVEQLARKYFAIDSRTGAIRTVTSLDYEQRNSVQFTVAGPRFGNAALIRRDGCKCHSPICGMSTTAPHSSARDLYEASILVPTYQGVIVLTGKCHRRGQ